MNLTLRKLDHFLHLEDHSKSKTKTQCITVRVQFLTFFFKLKEVPRKQDAS